MNRITAPRPPHAPTDYNVLRVRQDFPALQQLVHGRPLVYLDSAATSQKPQIVIDTLDYYYCHDNSNVHRGLHALSERATAAYERARSTVQRFINAASAEEIVFVRGTTEAINLVAQSYARPRLQVGDEIIISTLEHHSNIVPWQLVCQQTGAQLRIIPINEAGEILLDEYYKLLSKRTKLVAVNHISNALGTINPLQLIIQAAHAQGVPVLLDGAQGIVHGNLDVQRLDCDFYAFSGHKIYGPTGIGVLYAKAELLNAMPPYQGGGEMIKSVTFAHTEYNTIPHKFEAGTPPIAGAIGLATALDYFTQLGPAAIHAHEQSLLSYAIIQLEQVPGLRLIGTAANKAAILSFTLDVAHPHDIGTILDHQGIAVRAGHHCCMPLMAYFNVPATVRASFALYNTHAEVDALVAGLAEVRRIFT